MFDKDKEKKFRISAGFYLRNKEISDSFPDVKAKEISRRYIEEDISFVESVLELFCTKCGPAARLVIYLVYVEKHTQENTASYFGLTRRQLQLMLEQWKEIVFSDENEDFSIDKEKAFKESCQLYSGSKRLVNECKDEDKKKYIVETITYAEEALRETEIVFGIKMRSILEKLYIDKKPQPQAAKELNISRRTLQYMIQNWQEEMF